MFLYTGARSTLLAVFTQANLDPAGPDAPNWGGGGLRAFLELAGAIFWGGLELHRFPFGKDDKLPHFLNSWTSTTVGETILVFCKTSLNLLCGK